METLWQDIRHGARVLQKSPGFSAVAILSLALGIGANTTIFTVVNAILLHPLPVKEISQLVEVDTIDTKTHVGFANATKMGLSFPNFQDYQRGSQVFSGLTCIVPLPLTWSGGAEPKQINAQMVSANYFEVLGLQPAAGRFFLPDEDTKLSGNNVAVVSHSFWTNKLGSDPNVAGKILTLNAMPYTVIGVAPRGFKGTFTFGSAEQIWIPTSMYPQVLSGLPKEFFNDRRFLSTLSAGRLKQGIGLGQAEASLKTMASTLEKEYPKDNAGRSIALTALAEAAVGANQHDQIALAGTMMMSVVGLVLLIACANLANLLLARAARREKEMGLRAALGASRHRLIRQMLTECILLSLLGGAVGLVIAYVGRSVLWSFRPPFIEQNDLDLSLDSHVLLFTLGISLLTGLLFGVAPAFKASVPNLIETLKLGGRGGSISWGRNRLRGLLVVSEIALSLVALVGAGLFIRSMRDAQQMDPGFESKNLFMMAFDLGALHYGEGRAQQFFRAAVERAGATPGVKGATVASNFPLGGGFARTVFPEGESESTGYRGTLTQLDNISPGYFDTLGIPLVRGRVFSDGDRKDTTPVAVINEAMAKHFWPNQEPIGKRFHFFGDATQQHWRSAGTAGLPAADAGICPGGDAAGAHHGKTGSGDCRRPRADSGAGSKPGDHQRANDWHHHGPGIVGAADGSGVADRFRRTGAGAGGAGRVWYFVLLGESADARDWHTNGHGGRARTRAAPSCWTGTETDGGGIGAGNRCGPYADAAAFEFIVWGNCTRSGHVWGRLAASGARGPTGVLPSGAASDESGPIGGATL